MGSKNIFKNEKVSIIFKYSSIKYVALILGFVKGIINARVLGPELMGVLGNLLLILTYLSFGNLGILYAMNRQYVLYKDRDENKANEVLETSFTFMICISTLIMICGIFSKSVLFKNQFGTYLLIVFVIAILEQFKSYYINYYRLMNEFTTINYVELINNVLMFSIICIFIWNFKINAVLYSMLIADFVIFLYSIYNSERFRLKVNKKILKDLIIVGIPLLVYNLGFYILTTVDRVMTMKFLTYKDLGYYTFSNQIVAATVVFIESILFLYYPEAIKSLNIEQGRDTKKIYVKSKKYTKYLEVLGVALCSVGCILIYPFVKIITPGYDASITIYRILILAMVAFEIVFFANVFIVSNKKQIYLIILQLIMIFSAISFNYMFIKIGYGIIGIALAALLTNFIYATVQYIIYLKIIKIGGIKFIIFVQTYYKFIVYSIIVVLTSLLNINIWIYSITIISITGILYLKDSKDLITGFTKEQ